MRSFAHDATLFWLLISANVVVKDLGGAVPRLCLLHHGTAAYWYVPLKEYPLAPRMRAIDFAETSRPLTPFVNLLPWQAMLRSRGD